MKYLLLMNFRVDGVAPMNTWAEEDVEAHVEFQIALNKRLTNTGELLTWGRSRRPSWPGS
jgi:hypothetical protein